MQVESEDILEWKYDRTLTGKAVQGISIIHHLFCMFRLFSRNPLNMIGRYIVVYF